ncbi:MAG: ribonuclease P protein component [Actinomycetes bacterium]
MTRAGSVSRPESLRTPKDFRRVLGAGTRRRSGGIVLVSAPGRPGPPRVGLVVPRSVGKAVVRNRIKRRLRHAAAMAPLEPGVDYVIIANRSVEEVPFTELRGWLERALEGR